MQITGKRIFTAVMVVGTAVSTYQILSKPEQVGTPLLPADARAAAESFDQKLGQLQAPRTEDSRPAQLHFTSEELNAELAESTGTLTASNGATTRTAPDSTVGQSSVQIKSYQVSLDGDTARGQCIAHLAGADVYVTLAGHVGSKNGYVTFDPTEFKIGELSIPVSLVNPALQKKLAEQREQLKLPAGIESLGVENGELVITQQ